MTINKYSVIISFKIKETRAFDSIYASLPEQASEIAIAMLKEERSDFARLSDIVTIPYITPEDKGTRGANTGTGRLGSVKLTTLNRNEQ